jgi:gas vesicle protein
VTGERKENETMAENDSDFGTFLVGFIIGGLAGAAAALLLAPQSGEETRTLIRDKSIELKDKAMETAEEARIRAEEAAAEARARAEELTQQARARAEELQQRGKQVLEEQKHRIETAMEAGKKAAQEKKEELGSEPPPTATPM